MLDPGLPGVKIATNHIQLFNYARPIKFKKNTLRNHIFCVTRSYILPFKYLFNCSDNFKQLKTQTDENQWICAKSTKRYISDVEYFFAYVS